MDIITKAREFADAQAKLRKMSPEEYFKLQEDFITTATAIQSGGKATSLIEDPATAIQKSTILCCICGKPFKLITAAHLRQHGVTPEEYRRMCGYPPGTVLACHTLREERTNGPGVQALRSFYGNK